jgi:gas vesicle protein
MANRAMSFLCGISAGAAIALLYAPMSGVRTRATIRGKAKKGRRYIEEQSDELRNQIKRGRQVLSRAGDGLKAASHISRNVVRS